MEIPTIHGPVKMKIPAGTEPGRVFKLKGYGVSKLKTSERGDHFATVKVKIPQKLSAKQRGLFEELAKEEESKPKTKKGFFGI